MLVYRMNSSLIQKPFFHTVSDRMRGHTVWYNSGWCVLGQVWSYKVLFQGVSWHFTFSPQGRMQRNHAHSVFVDGRCQLPFRSALKLSNACLTVPCSGLLGGHACCPSSRWSTHCSRFHSADCSATARALSREGELLQSKWPLRLPWYVCNLTDTFPWQGLG